MVYGDEWSVAQWSLKSAWELEVQLGVPFPPVVPWDRATIVYFVSSPLVAFLPFAVLVVDSTGSCFQLLLSCFLCFDFIFSLVPHNFSTIMGKKKVTFYLTTPVSVSNFLHVVCDHMFIKPVPFCVLMHVISGGKKALHQKAVALYRRLCHRRVWSRLFEGPEDTTTLTFDVWGCCSLRNFLA